MVRGKPGNQEGTHGIKTSYNRTRTIIMEPIPPSRIGIVRGSGIPPSRPRCMTISLAPPTKAGPFSRGQLLVNERGAQVVEVTLLTAMTWAANPFSIPNFCFCTKGGRPPFCLRPQTHGAVRQMRGVAPAASGRLRRRSRHGTLVRFVAVPAAPMPYARATLIQRRK